MSRVPMWTDYALTAAEEAQARRLPYVYDDGGREAAGYRGSTGDCVPRAIAIATGLGYRDVYRRLHETALADDVLMAKLQLRYGKHARRHASPRTGVQRRTYDALLTALGWEWTPTMAIGQGCTVHLAAGELPEEARLIVRLSRHLSAVVDGVVRDTHDPGRDGTRCVYGYWREP